MHAAALRATAASWSWSTFVVLNAVSFGHTHISAGADIAYELCQSVVPTAMGLNATVELCSRSMPCFLASPLFALRASHPPGCINQARAFQWYAATGTYTGRLQLLLTAAVLHRFCTGTILLLLSAAVPQPFWQSAIETQSACWVLFVMQLWSS